MKNEEKEAKPSQTWLSSFRHTVGKRKTENGKRSKRQLLKKTAIILAAFFLLCTSGMYSVALWYQHEQAGKPYQLGVSFIPSYASYLGLDPQKTLSAIITDLGVRQFRLVSYWNEIETSPGTYDFTQLDWEFHAIEKAGGHISLAVGLRQPRWPECHAPAFYDTSQPRSKWEPALLHFMAVVINHYKDSPALQSYQLENEYLNTFGDCHNSDRARLQDELTLLHEGDPKHPVVISRSDNYAGFAMRQPLGDINGISVYRRVWDATLTKHYVNYPFPSWYYAFLAGAQQIISGQSSVIHELQTEPWPPHGQNILQTSLAEQSKTFDAARLHSTVKFAEQTGIRHIDLWGAEYWYYRTVTLHDPSIWNTAKHTFTN